MTFRLTALGVGDAFSAKWYSTCLLLEAEGARLLVDCPHPIRKILAESAPGVDVPDIDAILLTHLHADHSSGLEGYGFFSWFVLKRAARLVAHPAVVERLWDAQLAASMDRLITEPRDDAVVHEHRFADFFDHVPIEEGEVLDVGPFTVECRRTIHHIPTTAFRVRAAGRTLGYSADTAFDPSLVEWLAPADLIVHETNLGVHTPYEDLAALPEPLRARMRLVHYPDFFDVEGSVIACLEHGQTIDV